MTILRFGDVCQVPKINKKDSIADRILVFHAKIYVFYFLCLNILNEIENKAGLDFISPGLSFYLFIYISTLSLNCLLRETTPHYSKNPRVALISMNIYKLLFGELETMTPLVLLDFLVLD